MFVHFCSQVLCYGQVHLSIVFTFLPFVWFAEQPTKNYLKRVSKTKWVVLPEAKHHVNATQNLLVDTIQQLSMHTYHTLLILPLSWNATLNCELFVSCSSKAFCAHSFFVSPKGTRMTVSQFSTPCTALPLGNWIFKSFPQSLSCKKTTYISNKVYVDNCI